RREGTIPWRTPRAPPAQPPNRTRRRRRPEVKTSRMQWMMLCAALALPMTAWAQHGQAPSPSAPPAPQAPHDPEDSDQEFNELVALGDDGGSWFGEGEEGGPGGDMHRG